MRPRLKKCGESNTLSWKVFGATLQKSTKESILYKTERWIGVQRVHTQLFKLFCVTERPSSPEGFSFGYILH